MVKIPNSSEQGEEKIVLNSLAAVPTNADAGKSISHTKRPIHGRGSTSSLSMLMKQESSSTTQQQSLSKSKEKELHSKNRKLSVSTFPKSGSPSQKNHRPPPIRPNANFLRELNQKSESLSTDTYISSSTSQEDESSERASLELPRNLLGSNNSSKVASYKSYNQVQIGSQPSVVKNSKLQQQQTVFKAPYTSFSVNNNREIEGQKIKRMMITPSASMRRKGPFLFVASSFIPYSNIKRDTSDEDSSSHISTPLSAMTATQSTTTTVSDEESSFKKCFCGNSSETYDPYFLDDPEIRGSKQKKVMILKGMITSTIPFVKSGELKRDMNDQFKKKHSSWFNKKTELTLSMIRQIKSLMIETIEAAAGQMIEVSTVAMAFAYFEKLILQNLVTKQNRKLMAATCLFLSFKFNNEAGGSKRSACLQWFFDEMEHQFGISKKAILQHEFQVFAKLQFDLNLPRDQWLPHVQHILRESEGKTETWCQSIVSMSQTNKENGA